MEEEQLDKRNVKIVEEMFMERDWTTEGRSWDESLEEMVMESRRLSYDPN